MQRLSSNETSPSTVEGYTGMTQVQMDPLDPIQLYLDVDTLWY